MRVAVAFGICVLLAGACSSFEEGADPTPIPGDGGTGLDGTVPSPDAAAVADGGGTDATPPPDPSLLAHWKLDDDGEVAKDAVGKSDGTRSGGSWASGMIGGAFSTGGAGHIAIASVPKLSPMTTFTVAAWIAFDEKPGEDSYIFTHGVSWYVKLNGRRPQITMGDAFFGVTKEVPSGGWHHVAVTFDAGVPAIWINAAPTAWQEGDFPDSTRPAADTGALIIGAAYGGSNPSVGLVDDVRLYDRVLSESEIEVLAQRK